MQINDFSFSTVPSITLQRGAMTGLDRFIEAQFLRTGPKLRSCLIITDRGVEAAGLLTPALAALARAGITAQVRNDVVADPPEHVIACLGEAAAQAGDLIIGFGGGSSMDAAKLASVLATGEQPLREMYGIDRITASRKPLLLIPTTAGTGSEVTPIAIVTTGKTTKSGIVSDVLYPDAALLDPDLTLGLPPHVTAATGVDAMVHAIEAYTSRVRKNPLSDNLALQALGLLTKAIPQAVADGGDKDARARALLGAMLAGQAFANAPVGAVHALAYPLGGIFHLPHGLSNALVLPFVLHFNLDVACGMYAELYSHVTGDMTGSIEARARGFVDYMTEICEKVGMRQKLRDHGIAETDLEKLAEDAMQQTRLLGNNPKSMTYEAALGIYHEAW